MVFTDIAAAQQAMDVALGKSAKIPLNLMFLNPLDVGWFAVRYWWR